MTSSVRTFVLFSLSVFMACQGPESDGPPQDTEPPVERSSGQAAVSWLRTDATESWWLEERLAPWPEHAGDRDLGLRQLVRATPANRRQIIWSSTDPERLTSAVVDTDGSWSGVGVDGAHRPFLIHGNVQGELSRIVLDDPALAADPNAWLGSTPPSELRLGVLSEDSVRIGGSASEVVISLMNDHNAVLAYRWRWDGAGWQRGARTLVTPASAETPFLPIGATYDNFDAIVSPFNAHLAVAADGAAYVALAATSGRLKRHNAVFGTRYEPLRSNGDLSERPTDLLVTRIGRDGAIAWSRLVGTPDVDDEIYAAAAGPAGSVALVGRARRERGLDNTEWHATATTLDAAGATTAAVVFDTADSGIAQCAAFAADGSLYVGGTESWLQNPGGFSLYKEGRPFLLHLGSSSGSVVRKDQLLPATAGHAELRAISIAADRLWLAGFERGPLTHSGDQDRSVIRADGWRASAGIP